MKNLTTAFRTGDLRPKERMLLLVQNQVAKDTTGKEILSEADKHALSEGWRPANNDEVHEYNRYNEGMNLMNTAVIDAQTTFLNAQTAHFRKQPLVLKLLQYAHHREMRMSLERMRKIKRVDLREATVIIEKQKVIKLKNGLDFDYAVYELAFASLSDEDKARMNDLYPDVETDPSYLDQEEVITNLLDGKETLTQKNKEKLAELVSEHCYNKFAKKYQLYHYFACIPLAEVARQFLISKGIEANGKPLAQNQECDDEDSDTHDAIQKAVETYAKDHSISIEEILKGACLHWINEDLFEQYTPLALSNSSELFDRWLVAKSEARGTLQKHIKKGELKVRGRSPDESMRNKLYSKCLYDAELKKSRQALETMGLQSKRSDDTGDQAAFATFSDKVLTGESLYSFNGGYAFVKDFKETVDTYHANLGLVYADDDAEERGEHLDQELLIADMDKDGELNFFSVFGLAARRLSMFIESVIYFEEIEQDGETVLTFNEQSLKRMFIEMKDDLIDGYSTVLSFKEMFEKLSKVYEVDVSYHVAGYAETLEGYIDAHNNALAKAAGQMPDKEKKLFLYAKSILKIDGTLLIDKENIKPNTERTGKYFEKFRNCLGDEFKLHEQNK